MYKNCTTPGHTDAVRINFDDAQICFTYPVYSTVCYECNELGFETQFENKEMYTFKGKDVGGYLLFRYG